MEKDNCYHVSHVFVPYLSLISEVTVPYNRHI